jgi:hypothetical protein
MTVAAQQARVFGGASRSEAYPSAATCGCTNLILLDEFDAGPEQAHP